MSELPDGNNNAEYAGAVCDRFQSSAAFFFGPYEESVGGFFVVIHKSFVWLVRDPYAMAVPRNFSES